jgi:hypothetical protein
MKSLKDQPLPSHVDIHCFNRIYNCCRQIIWLFFILVLIKRDVVVYYHCNRFILIFIEKVRVFPKYENS